MKPVSKSKKKFLYHFKSLRFSIVDNNLNQSVINGQINRL